MAPFYYGWGSTASRLQPLQGGSLPFTIQFPEIPGIHFIDLGRIKKNLQIISKLKPYINQYNWKDIKFPSDKEDWKRLEKV